MVSLYLSTAAVCNNMLALRSDGLRRSHAYFCLRKLLSIVKNMTEKDTSQSLGRTTPLQTQRFKTAEVHCNLQNLDRSFVLASKQLYTSSALFCFALLKVPLAPYLHPWTAIVQAFRAEAKTKNISRGSPLIGKADALHPGACRRPFGG